MQPNTTATSVLGSNNYTSTANLYEQEEDESKDSDADEEIKRYIWVIGGTILLTVGTVGNVLALLVLCRRKMRRQKGSVYLVVVAVTDLAVLYTGLLRHVVLSAFQLDVRNLSVPGCRLHTTLVYFLLDFSAWVLALLSLERLLSVRSPLDHHQHCTRCTSAVVIVVAFVVLFALNSPFLFIIGHATVTRGNASVTYSCLPLSERDHNFISKVWPWIDLTVFALLPLAIHIVSNVLIVHGVKRSLWKSGRTKSDSSSPQGSGTSHPSRGSRGMNHRGSDTGRGQGRDEASRSAQNRECLQPASSITGSNSRNGAVGGSAAAAAAADVDDDDSGAPQSWGWGDWRNGTLPTDSAQCGRSTDGSGFQMSRDDGNTLKEVSSAATGTTGSIEGSVEVIGSSKKEISEFVRRTTCTCFKEAAPGGSYGNSTTMSRQSVGDCTCRSVTANSSIALSRDHSKPVNKTFNECSDSCDGDLRAGQPPQIMQCVELHSPTCPTDPADMDSSKTNGGKNGTPTTACDDLVCTIGPVHAGHGGTVLKATSLPTIVDSTYSGITLRASNSCDTEAHTTSALRTSDNEPPDGSVNVNPNRETTGTQPTNTDMSESTASDNDHLLSCPGHLPDGYVFKGHDDTADFSTCTHQIPTECSVARTDLAALDKVLEEGDRILEDSKICCSFSDRSSGFLYTQTEKPVAPHNRDSCTVVSQNEEATSHTKARASEEILEEAEQTEGKKNTEDSNTAQCPPNQPTENTEDSNTAQCPPKQPTEIKPRPKSVTFQESPLTPSASCPSQSSAEEAHQRDRRNSITSFFHSSGTGHREGTESAGATRPKASSTSSSDSGQPGRRRGAIRRKAAGDERCRSRYEGERRMMVGMRRMLVGVSVVFCVTTLPISLYLIIRWIQVGKAYRTDVIYAALSVLMYANNAANFILYCLASSSFRREMKATGRDLLRRCGRLKTWCLRLGSSSNRSHHHRSGAAAQALSSSSSSSWKRPSVWRSRSSRSSYTLTTSLSSSVTSSGGAIPVVTPTFFSTSSVQGSIR